MADAKQVAREIVDALTGDLYGRISLDNPNMTASSARNIADTMKREAEFRVEAILRPHLEPAAQSSGEPLTEEARTAEGRQCHEQAAVETVSEFASPSTSSSSPAPSEGARTKVTIDDEPNENREFNDKWHLATGNRVSTWGTYHTKGEPLITGNVGHWYETAVFWRKRCEAAEAIGVKFGDYPDHFKAVLSQNTATMTREEAEREAIKLVNTEAWRYSYIKVLTDLLMRQPNVEPPSAPSVEGLVEATPRRAAIKKLTTSQARLKDG